jgi:hypothetical protein
MHNTIKANLEFQITFTETNLRYALGDIPQDNQLIEFLKLNIEAAKLQLHLLDGDITMEQEVEVKENLKRTLTEIFELQKLRPSFGSQDMTQKLHQLFATL